MVGELEQEEVSSEKDSDLQRKLAAHTASSQFEQVLLPAIIGAAFGMLAQWALTTGRIEVGFDSSSYLTGLLQLYVVLAGSVPAILIHAGAQKRHGTNLAEFLAGETMPLVLAALFSLLFPWCLLPVSIFLWFYITMSWSKFELPDFRRGTWAGIGAIVGTLVGALAMSMLMS